MAFSPSLVLSPCRGYHGNFIHFSKTTRVYHANRVKVSRRWHASSIPEPEQGGNTADDDALNLELRNKVNELFGSRQNVSIEMEADSNVQFRVRKREVEYEYRQTKAAWSVIGSVAALSVAAGIAFIVLYATGAVHGSPNERRYDMPTFGTTSYIDPYELLEEESQFQDDQTLSK
ncbi:unnamed protein product [Chondrus crispus]|uniref:Uncharacterized protein n=1 Tax=Chondrus crispus TaxID=2769 RepID=R7Q2I8_CHOCR|nr:unnamed protein product [Chondrus crispus]CDF32093.1 unnamed protein product [Chondrus crispus]|eukprot:XP_005711758.1 unnamed protein product [Chondrus crispus]